MIAMEDETVCGSTPHGLSIKMRHRLKLSNEFSLNPNQKWRSRCGIRLHLLASSAKRKLSCPAMCCVVGCHNPISRRISEAQGPRPQRIAIVSYGAGGPEEGGWALPEIWSVGSSARSRDLSLPQSSLLFLHARLRLRVDFHFILANNSPDRYSGI